MGKVVNSIKSNGKKRVTTPNRNEQRNYGYTGTHKLFNRHKRRILAYGFLVYSLALGRKLTRV